MSNKAELGCPNKLTRQVTSDSVPHKIQFRTKYISPPLVSHRNSSPKIQTVPSSTPSSDSSVLAHQPHSHSWLTSGPFFSFFSGCCMVSSSRSKAAPPAPPELENSNSESHVSHRPKVPGSYQITQERAKHLKI